MGNERRIIYCKHHDYRGEDCPTCADDRNKIEGRTFVRPDQNQSAKVCVNHSGGVLQPDQECPGCAREREAKTPDPPPPPAPHQPHVWINRNEPKGL